MKDLNKNLRNKNENGQKNQITEKGLQQNGLDSFGALPVHQAVLSNALPAMAAMLMVLIYNLADTFFIGQTHNDILVAAVSLATPIFLIFMSVGSVFGIGGTSVISRAIGEGNMTYAKKVCAFCMWGCVATGLVMSVLFLVFMDQILLWAGATTDTWAPAKIYLVIVSFGGVFSVIANCFSNILRAEGESGKAMTGQVLGNLLNVVLDPIMILWLDWGIAGAAIATVIGNVVGSLYYISYYLCGKSYLSIHPNVFTVKEKVCSSVLMIGIPASLGSLLMSVSQIIMNMHMVDYGDMALAGIGVAMKVTMIAGMISMGFASGVQPLLGYCIGAKQWNRFKEILRFSLGFTFLLSAVMTVLCYFLTNQIVGVFLTETISFDYAVQFTQILLSTCAFIGVFFVLVNTLQAMGAATSALIINLSRQGIIYIPALFLMEVWLGEKGLVWAQPVADILSTVLVALLCVYNIRKMMRQETIEMQ